MPVVVAGHHPEVERLIERRRALGLDAQDERVPDMAVREGGDALYLPTAAVVVDPGASFRLLQESLRWP